jgi:hypothetical protein
MIKTRTWMIAILLLLAFFGGLAVWQGSRPASGMVANIYVDGVCVHSVDLSKVVKAETYSMSDEFGSNVIQIEPGRICVSDADCPDQVCVQAGWLTDRAAPIVCLPHKLVIRLETTDQAEDISIDAVSQ